MINFFIHGTRLSMRKFHSYVCANLLDANAVRKPICICFLSTKWLDEVGVVIFVVARLDSTSLHIRTEHTQRNNINKYVITRARNSCLNSSRMNINKQKASSLPIPSFPPSRLQMCLILNRRNEFGAISLFLLQNRHASN